MFDKNKKRANLVIMDFSSFRQISRFNSISNTYDEHTLTHREISNYLNSITASFIKNYEDLENIKVYEFGCGTGNLSSLLVNNYSNITISDGGENMILATKEKLSRYQNLKIDYKICDFNNHNSLKQIFSDKKFPSMAVSSMAFQWSDNIYQLISKLSESVNFISFSVPNNDSFQILGDQLANYGIKFNAKILPSNNGLIKFLKNNNTVNFINKQLQFSHNLHKSCGREVFNYFKNIGARCPQQNDVMSNFTNYKNFLSTIDDFSIDYCVSFFVIRL